MSRIKFIKAIPILDSRGNPTVEVSVKLDNNVSAKASVPSGASTGTREAVELRDNDPSKYLGKGVNKAVSNVNDLIFPALINMEATDQHAVDQKMIDLDGTENKCRLGANAILGVSLAVAKAAAASLGLPFLFKYIGELYGESNPRVLPVPMINFINGGVHAHNNLDFQEFMLMPLGAKNFFEALRMGSEIFGVLREKPEIKGVGVGDEGGFSPFLEKKGKAIIEEAIRLLLDGIEEAGYIPGKDICIALDPATSEFYKEGRYALGNGQKSPEDMVELYSYLVDKYPIVSIEDGLAEKDELGWKLITKKLGDRIQLVGDDLFVTNPKIFKRGIEDGIANAILIKVNQIGTLTETLKTIKMAHDAGYAAVISHRSGETEDTTISDLAVGCNAGQIKTGCVSRTDRVAKYNQLLRIAKYLGNDAVFLGNDALRRGVKREKVA